MVALYVSEPSQVELTVADHVRLDRVTEASAERHGDLIRPGTTSMNLAEGTYLFRTGADAQVRADAEVIQVIAVANDKDGGPIDPTFTAVRAALGDSVPDRVPTLTVLI
jgi:hypothetical protein